jgi:hypothetical protein
MELDERKQRITALEREIGELKASCPHRLSGKDSLRCDVCGRGFGWRCPESPDGVCHYYTEEDGKIHLIDGRKVDVPDKDHDPQYETDDSCLFCREPSERK